MQLTTLNHFNRNKIAIPNNATTSPEGEALTLLMAEMESVYLVSILGYSLFKELYDAYEASIAVVPVPLTSKWLDLINGVEFTDSNGKVNKWTGFTDTKLSPIANYIYCEWQKIYISSTTGNGEQSPILPNSKRVTPIDKIVSAWNEMVDINSVLHDFLINNATVYDTYVYDLNSPLFKYRNQII